MPAELEHKRGERRVAKPLASSDVALGRKHEERIVIRCWPKALCLWPLAALGLVFAAITGALLGHDRVREVLGLTYFGIGFALLIVLCFDCPGWSILWLGLSALCMILIFTLLSFYFNVIAGLIWLLSNAHLYASPQAYVFFSFSFLFVWACALVVNRFDYWEITPNELLHNKGPWSDLERFPAANIRVDKAIPDVFEWCLCGGGRLVIFPTSERQAVVLEMVLNVNRVENRIKHLLGALEVRVDQDR